MVGRPDVARDTEDIDFAGFARVTVDAAAARFGQGSTEHAGRGRLAERRRAHRSVTA